jgi:membrane-associated HD superfamily phosphohydrolase
MPTVQEILKDSGLTDEQITALDAKVTGAFTQVLSSASQTLEQAELAKRAQAQQYDESIAPALDAWANEKTQKDAEIAFYRAQLEGAKAGGFIPTTAPGTPAPTTSVPGRNPNGTFVAGNNPVPGSPTYMTKEEGFNAVTTATWFISEYMRLNNGSPPPDSLEALANEAAAQRMPLKVYVEKKYEFPAKREAIKVADQKKHDDSIRSEEREKTTKEITERLGSNPMIRQAETSRFSVLDKAVKDGERPNPLKQTREQRHQATRQAIQKEIAANETIQ